MSTSAEIEAAADPPAKRSNRWRRMALRACVIVAVLALFFLATRGFWITTVRAYFIGRLYLAGEEFGSNLPEVDEVEILALGPEGKEGDPDSFRPDLGPPIGTVNRRIIRGDDAAALAKLWRQIDFDKHYSAICHVPYYALRFRDHGHLILETSVCWHCRNITLPVGIFSRFYYGFDAKSEEGQRLLAVLTEYAPHPKETQ